MGRIEQATPSHIKYKTKRLQRIGVQGRPLSRLCPRHTPRHRVVNLVLATRSRKVKKRHIRLCLVDRLQQLLKDRTDSWGVIWATRSIESKHRDAKGDLLQGQQGTFKHFGGECRGREQEHRIWNDCSQCSHRHPATVAPLPNRRCRPVLATIA